MTVLLVFQLHVLSLPFKYSNIEDIHHRTYITLRTDTSQPPKKDPSYNYLLTSRASLLEFRRIAKLSEYHNKSNHYRSRDIYFTTHNHTHEYQSSPYFLKFQRNCWHSRYSLASKDIGRPFTTCLQKINLFSVGCWPEKTWGLRLRAIILVSLLSRAEILLSIQPSHCFVFWLQKPDSEFISLLINRKHLIFSLNLGQDRQFD